MDNSTLYRIYVICASPRHERGLLHAKSDFVELNPSCGFIPGRLVTVLNMLFYLSFTLVLGTLFNSRGLVSAIGLGFLFGGQIVPNFLPEWVTLIFPGKSTELVCGLALQQQRYSIRHIPVFDLDDRRMSYWPTKPIKLNLTMKGVTALTLSGSRTSQAGQIVADDLSDSGDADFAGQVTCQDIRTDGTGQFRAYDLHSQAAFINISGSGNTTLWTRGNLDVQLRSDGSVHYYGSPKFNTDKIEWLGDN